MPDTPAAVKQHKSVAVIYGASSEHTRVIAERVADDLRACGFPVKMHSVWGLEPFDLKGCLAAVLAAPMQMGMHEEAVVSFIKNHRAELERLPVAFISATLGKAGSSSTDDVPETPEQFDGDVQTSPSPFFAETGWNPMRVKSFAGAISYTQFSFFVRIAMKLLAKTGATGAGGGNQREAGWDALDIFVNEFAQEISAEADPAAAEPASGLPLTEPY